MAINDSQDVATDACLTADVCVVGAGAAGIAIAQELDGTGLDVLVLEAGGRKRDLTMERDLFAIDELEMPRLNPEASRARCFGGSTDLWFGRIAALDPIDFVTREWVPNSGWPIDHAELVPWLDRAARILDVPRFDRIDPASWASNPTAQAFTRPGESEIGVFLWSQSMHMGEAYQAMLERSNNVRVLLEATVAELVPNETSRLIDEIRVVRADGGRFSVRARAVVLAGGGLENPRLLLASTARSENGVGNEHDRVGRYLMDHLRGEGLATTDISDVDRSTLARLEYLGERTSTDSGTVQLRVKFSPTLQREHGLLNSSIHAHLVSSEQSNPGFQSAKRVAQRFRGAGPAEETPLGPDVVSVLRNSPVLARLVAKKLTGRVRATSVVFIDQMEQEPDPESRVRVDLGHRDRFGLPRLSTEWRIGSSTYRSLHHMHSIMAETLRATGVAEFRSSVLETPDVEPELWDMKHPSGTTRMSSSPADGVVDADGRVHGMDNLYITGSSVFPTVGHANPTLTIVALAARLAHHLARHLAP